MAFVRSAWKILVAMKDGLALLFLLLFFALLFAALRAGPNPAAVRDGALLINLNGFISEQPEAVDPLTTLLTGETLIGEYRQRDIIRALKLAESDGKIKAVVLDLDSFLGGGQSSLAAIGDAIDRVKKAGKPVYSFATAYSDDGYQLAAHASQIWMDPLGGVLISGPGGTQLYYKGLLDRLGIKANVYRVGTFKSAVEPYIRADQSPEARASIQAVFDEIWAQWRADVSKARPAARLTGLLNDPAASVEAARGDLAQLAVQEKLVDRLGDRIAFGKFVAAKVGGDAAKTTGGYAQTSMAALLAANDPADNGDPIGVITIAGTLIDGEAGPGTAAGTTTANLIYDAIEDDDIKALVVRVDSPGGSVLASEKVRLALEAAKQKKLPIVVSMANLAASGGYWVATPADVIFAQPSTLTGSIGIFGILPSGKQALANIGINADGIKTTPLSGEPDVLGGFSPEFDRVMQSVIEDGYRDFLTRVATARGKSTQQIDAIGQGQVWAGGTARRLGLVDRIGGMDEALAEAARRAKLKDGAWHPQYFEPAPKGWAALLGGAAPAASAAAPMDLFARAAFARDEQWRRISADVHILLGSEGAQIRCLECGAMAGTPAILRRVSASKNDDAGWFGMLMRLMAASP